MAVVTGDHNSPPALAIFNRAGGGTHYGCGETVNLSVQVRPNTANVATFGGIQWKLKTAPIGTALGAVVAAAGTAVLTIGVKPGNIELEAWGVAPAHFKPLAKLVLKALAPSDVSYTKVPLSTVRHGNNQADAGFIGWVEILPKGVNFSNLQIIEWEYKSVASGGYAHFNNIVHPYTGHPGPPVWVAVVYMAATSQNMVPAPDDVYSGVAQPRLDPTGAPVLDLHGRSTYEAATFEWNIPWHYNLLGAPAVNRGEFFKFVVHKVDLNQAGRVTIQKHDSGQQSASYGDVTIGYSRPALGFP